LHSVADEGHSRSSFVVAAGEHERSKHGGPQDSIVPAFLGKVNQSSGLRRRPQIQTFQESLEGLHSHKVSSNQLSCNPVTLCVSRRKSKWEIEVVESSEGKIE
jgi:hypothetical protein